MPESRSAPPRRFAAVIDAAALTLAVAAAFWPVFHNGFVSWDDPSVLLDNENLRNKEVVSWAFSTTFMGHYQPLAWMAWSAALAQFGASPAAFHALSLLVHAANGLLVYALTLRLTRNAAIEPGFGRAAALLAGLLFLVHPTAVEAVAWASAFPYVLSLFVLLLSFLAYVNGQLPRSIALYAVSLVTRATALGYPLLLLVADFYPLGRRSAGIRRLLVEKVPFAILAAAAGAVEWRARDVATLQDIAIAPRMTLALDAPFIYLWRSVWPVRLSPLNPLPIAPATDVVALALAAAGIVAVSALSWRLRARWPIVAAAWTGYLILIAPVAGFTPSGVQATADRYVYVPNVIVALVAGAAMAMRRSAKASAERPADAETAYARLKPSRYIAGAAFAALVVVACGGLTAKQTQYWRDSTTLWARAIEIDPRNDVAAYNLAVAYAEAGRDDEAVKWYERTLALIPDHDLARRNLAVLQASAAERNADRLIAAGRADEASEEYARALALDPKRVHAHAARGMLLLRRGDLHDAVGELRAAVDGGTRDLEVPNGLAFALLQTGDAAQAAAVLSRAVDAHPDDINLKHNLARLLATAPDPRVRDGARALRLALEVDERTGHRDPRALDTLSAAYALVGQIDRARETAARAAARAREVGDAATAAEIDAHARRYTGR
ncbi:MAG TPA: tetratricopeptide repeat protein [Vicinamibacterales bacterium]|nr:tetratricopeptide repeat protein [Vicinamibacterales bacterium]